MKIIRSYQNLSTKIELLIYRNGSAVDSLKTEVELTDSNIRKAFSKIVMAKSLSLLEDLRLSCINRHSSKV